MKLQIDTGNDLFSFRFPGCVALNPTAVFLFFCSKTQSFTYAQARAMCKGLKAVRRACPQMPLFELRADDVFIRITW